MTTTSKIRIKLGAIEVDFEGSEEFLKKELPELLSAVSKLYQASGGSRAGIGQVDDEVVGSPGGVSLSGTTGTIAAKLSCKSGPDLLTAAAAQLTFVGRKSEFTRAELGKAQRQASNYYKRTYANNMSKYLGSLVANKTLLEVREGVYALDAKKKAALEAALASS